VAGDRHLSAPLCCMPAHSRWIFGRCSNLKGLEEDVKLFNGYLLDLARL
jgi:hypothetical protein